MSGEIPSNNPENKNEQAGADDKKWEAVENAEFSGDQHEKENERLEVNLDDFEHFIAFGKAEIFAKKGSVNAEQLTQEGLEAGAYVDKDIRYDEASGKYVVDTYVMHEGEDGLRTAELEDTRPVEAGMWVLTNPAQQEGDHPNNYCQKDATFQKRYEATDEPGVYRAKGMARIIKNETGRKVEIDDPWGTKQQGDENCYFCVPYDPSNPFNIPEGKAYILSENDFANYGPAEEVRDDFVPLDQYALAQEVDAKELERGFDGLYRYDENVRKNAKPGDMLVWNGTSFFDEGSAFYMASPSNAKVMSKHELSIRYEGVDGASVDARIPALAGKLSTMKLREQALVGTEPEEDYDYPPETGPDLMPVDPRGDV